MFWIFYATSLLICIKSLYKVYNKDVYMLLLHKDEFLLIYIYCVIICEIMRSLYCIFLFAHYLFSSTNYEKLYQETTF